MEKPIPLDYLFEIYAVSFPRGKSGGELWHIRIRRKIADEILRLDGSRYVRLKTEANSQTRRFFDFFYRREAVDPLIGEYWSTRESPELFETLRQEWRDHPQIRGHPIFIRFQTTGPDSQIKMANLRSYRVIGVANPADRAPYIPTGQAVPDLENPKLEINPLTKRVIQRSSLAFHDWQEMDSVVWITREIAEEMADISRVWDQIYWRLLKSEKIHGTGKIATHREARRISRIFMDYARKHPLSRVKLDGFSDEGISWSRFAEIEAYRAQRAFHGYGHLQSTLIQNPDGLRKSDVISEFGPVNQREFDMHRWSLGFKSGPPPSMLNPLLQLTYENGNSSRTLTLERAIERITNDEYARLVRFGKLCPDTNIRALVKEATKNKGEFSRRQISDIAADLRYHFRMMGEGVNDIY